MMLLIEGAIQSVNMESFSNLCLATIFASLVGTLVKRATTSTNTRASTYKWCVLIKATNSLEFVICEIPIPNHER